MEDSAATAKPWLAVGPPCRGGLSPKGEPRATLPAELGDSWAARGSIRYIWNQQSLSTVADYVTIAQDRKDRDSPS